MSNSRFSRILVPVDGSKESAHAAAIAIDIAKRYNAEISVIHVININQYVQAIGLYTGSYPESLKKSIEGAKQEASSWFMQIQKEAEQNDIKATMEVIETPFSTVGGIVDYAEHHKIDLIVIGTRGRSGFTKLLLGSVASGVITYASCPVVVAR
jgi:nucleotide-binding universal stress UspA family protein